VFHRYARPPAQSDTHEVKSKTTTVSTAITGILTLSENKGGVQGDPIGRGFVLRGGPPPFH